MVLNPSLEWQKRLEKGIVLARLHHLIGKREQGVFITAVRRVK